MLPHRRKGEQFAIPTCALQPSDVAGFIDELHGFQSAFHYCFACSESPAHFFDYMGAISVSSHGSRLSRNMVCKYALVLQL